MSFIKYSAIAIFMLAILSSLHINSLAIGRTYHAEQILNSIRIGSPLSEIYLLFKQYQINNYIKTKEENIEFTYNFSNRPPDRFLVKLNEGKVTSLCVSNADRKLSQGDALILCYRMRSMKVMVFACFLDTSWFISIQILLLMIANFILRFNIVGLIVGVIGLLVMFVMLSITRIYFILPY